MKSKLFQRRLKSAFFKLTYIDVDNKYKYFLKSKDDNGYINMSYEELLDLQKLLNNWLDGED